MKPKIENIISDNMHSFRVNRSVLANFDNPWHFHSAYELLFILKSSGKRYVGDSIDNFYEGDMVLMGPKLPHVWKNGEEYYQNNPKLTAQAIVVQFQDNSFGSGFFDLPEMHALKALLKLSRRGISITGETRNTIAKELYAILNQKGIERFLSLIRILHILSTSKDLHLLAMESFEKAYDDSRSEKINAVFEYTANHFREDIQLLEVSEVANMSKTAFCRYFKAKSTKTFFEYLTDVRINYACRLLMEDKYSISEISYECGFNSPSYFTRKFKAVKKQTPKEYCDTYKPIIQS